MSLPSLGRIRYLLGQGQEDFLAGQFHRGGGLGVGQDDAVIADLDLDDLLDPVGRRRFPISESLIAREALVISGNFDAHSAAEQLEAAAGAGGFDLRGLELAGLAELLGYRGGKGVDGG